MIHSAVILLAYEVAAPHTSSHLKIEPSVTKLAQENEYVNIRRLPH